MSICISELFLSARPVALASGETLFRAGDPAEEMFLIRSGRVFLARHTVSGERLILHRAEAGMVLAEASAYAPRYHCDALSPEGATAAALPKARFLAALAADAALSAIWAGSLARAAQSARLKAEIRSLPRLAARLDAWLETGERIPEKGRVQELAAELGVTREALYRELARRRSRRDQA